MNTWRNLPGKIWVAIISLDPFLRRRSHVAAAGLAPGEAELFLDMSRYDLAHSLAVAGKLKDDPFLYKTALLHDAGKLRSDLGLFTRWLYTGIEVFLPSCLRRQRKNLDEAAAGESALKKARSLPRGWRRGLYVQFHHGEIGAEILDGLGSDAELIAIIGGHQGEPLGERAKRLAEVDDIF
jgi:hypothetical protein